ncbi:hypothetical protein DFH07DRAFT_546361 [Mycena maculata]|uniref:Uncharacterized protein n=1 Tax=Mycena maculata TaxID=230809 RepID=A0AAD7IU07_9AGAR|nr:hypothetical protein DFH07DRAFT_546361 [Mycena maculata]
MFTRKTSVQLPPAAAKASHDTDRTAFSSRSTRSARKPSRRGLQRADSQNTRYMNMLLALDGIPRLHNIFAAFFTWILLAGFVLLPGTFSSLQNVNASNVSEKDVVDAVQHLPLFVVAFVCSGIGAIGMVWLWWRWSKNYIWLNNRVFLPGATNSFAGVVSTLVNVYGVQHGEFVTTSKVTLIVTAAAAGILGALTLTYSLFLLKNVKREHAREVGCERAGRHGEGILEELKRKANEIEPEAGMV